MPRKKSDEEMTSSVSEYDEAVELSNATNVDEPARRNDEPTKFSVQELIDHGEQRLGFPKHICAGAAREAGWQRDEIRSFEDLNQAVVSFVKVKVWE